MTGAELAQLVSDGSQPVVTFKPPILEQEGYLEAGMRGRLVAVSNEPDGIVKFRVDLAEFDDFNRAFESANYFDKAGVPCLTAREAGYYKDAKESIYAGAADEVDFCEVEASPRFALYAEFRQSAAGRSYVQWLEDRVLAVAA